LGQDDHRGDVSKGLDNLLSDVRLGVDDARFVKACESSAKGEHGRPPFRMQSRLQCRLRKRDIMGHLLLNTCERDGRVTSQDQDGRLGRLRLTDHGGRPCERRIVFFLVDGVSGRILRSRFVGPNAPSAGGVSMFPTAASLPSRCVAEDVAVAVAVAVAGGRARAKRDAASLAHSNSGSAATRRSGVAVLFFIFPFLHVARR
jgi:hypothetical protein